jgi:hypothetical protein
VFVLSFPGADALSSIYGTILTQHLKLGNFPASLQKSVPQLINLALTFHQEIAATFLPTAAKFHYVFNLRDFANIFQVSSPTPPTLRSPRRLRDDPGIPILKIANAKLLDKDTASMRDKHKQVSSAVGFMRKT